MKRCDAQQRSTDQNESYSFLPGAKTGARALAEDAFYMLKVLRTTQRTGTACNDRGDKADGNDGRVARDAPMCTALTTYDELR